MWILTDKCLHRGYDGILVKPALSDWTYVVRVALPLGKLLVSAELSVTTMTSTSSDGCSKGKMALFWRARPPSTRESSFWAATSEELLKNGFG